MSSLFKKFLGRLVTHGSLTLVEASGTRTDFGDGTGPHHTLVFHDERLPRDLFFNPELAFAETYMAGRWHLEDGTLTGLLTLFFQNVEHGAIFGWRNTLRQLLRKLHQRNTARAARRNAHHHYDVGNDIYALFLDEDWQYSCAYFADPGMSLEEAQRAKKRHIAAKLLLEPGQKVLDIGCGWGGMGLYLANNAGVDVTGITLADEQVARASERARGRQDVRFRLQDYRDTEGPFDRIVSVGMFEHVGVGFYGDYFAAAERLLADDGVMVLHSIGRMDPPGHTSPFIAKYIFPGGYIPALSEVLSTIERTGLYVTDVEIWRLHYAETLKAWHERFEANRERVVALRDERFARMWEFYLAGSEAAFRAGDMMVFQIQLSKSLHAVPLTRDYMVEAERRLAATDGPATRPTLVARRG
ncbi:MAG: cyclopropane-fatty-acyl-phospholipid synthase family protein [Pseudomonadota bacterium]